MTLIITHLARRRILQSGDFLLTDRRTGEGIEYRAQKQIIVQRFRWTALVGFCGVAHTGREYVPEWIVRQLAAVPPDAPFDELLRRLRSAEVWLAGISPRHRSITFSIGAFVDFKPIFALISNFEAIGRPPRALHPREYSAALSVSYVGPRADRLVLSGRSGAVCRADRELLRRVLREAPPDQAYASLAEVHRRASVRDDAVGAVCFTSHVTVLGEMGGMVHEWPEDEDYLPAFMDVAGMILPRLRPEIDEHGRPKPLQLKSVSGASFTESADYFRIALAEKPTDPSILSNYGNWLKKRGRFDEAEASYRAAIASDDHFASAYGNLAILLDDIGDVDGAEAAYRRAVELDHGSVIHASNLAFFLWRRRGARDAAEALLLETLARQRDAFTISRNAYFNAQAFDDRHDAALELYEEALSMAPQDPWANGRLACLLLRIGDTDGARTHFERATSGEHPDVDALAGYAELQLSEGSHESAAELLRRALRLRRRDPAILAALAATRTLLAAADEDVEPLYRQVLEWQPDHPLSALNLAQILLKRDRCDAEASRLLVALHDADLTPEMRLELLFYGVAYDIDVFEDATHEIQELLETGVRVTAWDLSQEAEVAKSSGHRYADVLSQVAAVQPSEPG